MGERDLKKHGIKCPSCLATGNVETIESDSSSSGTMGFRIATVPSGFELERLGKNFMHTEFRCSKCGQTFLPGIVLMHDFKRLAQGLPVLDRTPRDTSRDEIVKIAFDLGNQIYDGLLHEEALNQFRKRWPGLTEKEYKDALWIGVRDSR